MSDHVLDRLADYLEGRLTPEDATSVRKHLQRCAECRADVAFAKAMREEGLRQGIGHLSGERLVELAEGRGEAATEPERAHLDRCADCRDHLAWAGDVAEDEEEETPANVTPIRPRNARVLWGGGGLLAIAALLLLVLRPGPDVDLASLARIERVPVSIPRSSPVTDPAEVARLRALESYRDGDWAAARVRLADVVAANPADGVARLYLGSAMLLAGDPGAALPELRAAAETVDDAWRGTARWQLANAELASGNTDGARSLLREIAAEGGPYAGPARDLVRAIGEPR